MKLSYNWLGRYLDLTGVGPEELAERLTNAGLEVEGLERMASGSNLVVGKILSCVDHPNSDHLHVCEVDIKTEILQIVCGAPNVAMGQKVIVAKVGAVLPEITIKEGTIRDVASNGMICSLVELGVDEKQLSKEDLDGIKILDDDAIVGDENPLKYLGLDDVLIDVSLTPNRNDCLAMWSLAKEVGAILDRRAHLPECRHKADIGKKSNLIVGSDSKNCTHFIGKTINRLTIKESPKWLKNALISSGIKPINNVVDISNYVMMETGQPLHFYDKDKITSDEITVKDDIAENYTALDGNDYAILKGDLVITTQGKVIGIAGIMGGEDSKIDENTQGIIIEAALFDMVSIRNTSRRLNLLTEASQRFQKGIEPLAPVKAVDRAVQLLLELADADEIEETVIFGEFNEDPNRITIRTDYLNGLLATAFSTAEIADVFRRLDLDPIIGEDAIQVTIPSYRTDLKLPVDLTEEVIRLLGYDTVPSTLPKISSTLGQHASNEERRYRIKETLKALGMSEVITYSLVNQTAIEQATWPVGEAIALSNPLSEQRKFYRTSLLSSVMEAAAYNQARSADEWSLFEIGNVYAANAEAQERLALAVSRSQTQNRWQRQMQERDFYWMKGCIVDLLNDLGFDSRRIFVEANALDQETFNPYQSAVVRIDRTLIGIFGAIHPKRASLWRSDICVMAEINLSAVYQCKTSKVKFNAIPRYPAVKYDLAMVVDEDVLVGDMVLAMRKQGGRLVTDIEVFDVYRGQPLPGGKKSIAFSIVCQSLEKTLTDKDLQPVQQAILDALKRQFQAVLRD